MLRSRLFPFAMLFVLACAGAASAQTPTPAQKEAARIAKDFAGQGDRASDYLKELLLTSPDNAQLAEALERRLERQNRHRDLIEIWGARLSNLPSAEALATRVQIADRQLKELGDAVTALRMAEEILQLENGEDDACRLLEQIAERPTSALGPRRRALEILRERYATARRPEDVIRVLEMSLNVVETEGQERELREAASGRAGTRLVPPGNLHVTLAFLGSRPQRELEAVGEALRSAAAGAGPIAFEPLRWRETRSVGMVVLADDGGSAGRLAVDLHKRLEALGVYERERRAWLPHVTVLRFRERPRLAPPLPALGRFAPSDAAAFLSRLHPSGARYEVLQSFALGGVRG